MSERGNVKLADLDKSEQPEEGAPLNELILEGLKRFAFSEGPHLLPPDGQEPWRLQCSAGLENVSEIKLTANSAEVRFYDRLRALQLLIDFSEKQQADGLIALFEGGDSS